MDKRKLATALKYLPDEHLAPMVVAKGMGLIAERIIEVAGENQVPVYQDEKLARQLENLQLGYQIPFELYDVVAQVLIFISYMDQEAKNE